MRYYILGIGGVAMASLAGLLKEKGHAVAGFWSINISSRVLESATHLAK